MAGDEFLAILNDFETGGLNENERGIIEYGALRVNRLTLEVLDEFELKVEPYGDVDPFAAQVNGYTPEAWLEAISQEKGITRYREFVGSVTRFVSWNTDFDRRFLRATERRTGIYIQYDYHNRDLVGIAEEKLEAAGVVLPRFKLDTVAEHLGIKPEEMPHRALRGAYKALEVWRALRTFS